MDDQVEITAEERTEQLETQLADLIRFQRHQNTLSVTAAAKLFEKSLNGNPKELTEFVDNVDSA